MPKSARISDTAFGQCCHGTWTGVWVSGSPDVDHNGLQAIRIGDIGVVSCPCSIMYAVSGSPDVDHNGIPSHRLGDAVVVSCGSGVTVSGSPDTDDNG